MKNTVIKTALIFTLFVFTQAIFAQDIEVHIGNESKQHKRDYVISTFPTSEGVLALKSKRTFFGGNSDYFFERFDKNMNFIKKDELNFPNDDLQLKEMFYLNEKIVCFMYKYDKKTNKKSLYATTLAKDGKFTNDIYEIAKIQDEKRRELTSHSVTLSSDSSKFLIRINPPFTDKDQMGERQFIIIDQNFKEIDNIRLKFPFKETDFSINRTHLDLYGNIHMLCSVNIEESKRKTIFKTNVEKEARIFTLYKGESDIHEYKINDINKDAGFISQIRMKTDKLGRLLCTGFYSDKKGNSTKGVFVFVMDLENKKVGKISSQEFTEKYLNQFLSDRQKRKKKRRKSRGKDDGKYSRLYHYKIRDIVLKNGGGFYLVAEYYIHYVTTRTDSKGNTTTTDHFNYDNLMVINVLKENSIPWYTKVGKEQHSTNDDGRYSGIVTGINKDNSLNIIFNDHRDNVNSIAGDDLKNLRLKRSKVVLVKFEENGKATKTPLFGSNKQRTYLVPSDSRSGQTNNLLLYSAYKRKNRFTNVILR